MTQLEKEALVIFKDYTMLQLKAFRVSEHQKSIGRAGGATEPYELMLIDQAIEYHRIYKNLKLTQAKNGK